MTNAEIARRSVRASFVLFVGNFIGTTASAIAVILIARLLGPAQYGVYTLSLVIPALVALFADLGVNTAATRYAAYYDSIGRPEEARRFTKNAIAFVYLVGVVFATINFLLAGILSNAILHRPELAQYVRLGSIYTLGIAMYQVGVASAIGWNRMGFASLSQDVQAALRLTIAPLLTVLGFGVMGAMTGFASASLLAGTVVALLLYSTELRGPSAGMEHFLSDVRQMVRYGFPAFAGLLVSSLAAYYVTIVLASISSNATVGYYQAGYNLVAPATLVASAMANALFPAFSRLDAAGADAQAALRYSVRYVALLVAPVLLFLLSASRQLIGLLYGASYGTSVPFVQLFAVANIPLALGYAVLPVFFNGFGKTRLSMASYMFGAGVLVLAAPAFSIWLSLGPYGLIWAILLSYSSTLAAGAVLATKCAGATLEVKPLVLLMLASSAAAAGCLLVQRLPVSNDLTLLMQFSVFFFLYLTLVPLLGAIRDADIERLRPAFSGMRLVSTIMLPILNYERLLLKVSSGESDETNGPSGGP